MNGKERVGCAMAREKPDRVPFFCQLSLGHYMVNTGFDPVDIWHSSETFAKALVTLAHRYKMDGILVNLPGRPADWRKHVTRTRRDGHETVVFWDDGTHTRCPDNDNAHHVSGRPLPEPASIDPDTLFYIDPHNITGIKHPFYYDFEDPAQSADNRGFPDYITRTLELLTASVGGELHISAEVFSPFTQIMEFFGYSEILMALVTDGELIEGILNRLTGGTAELAIMQARAGADAILVSSAFAGGGFISRDHYTRFVLPFEHSVIRQIHDAVDIPVYVHTCGSIGDRIDLMLEAGYDGIDTMDPPPLGNTDLGEVKKRFGKKLFLKGNIDPVNVIRYSTPMEVYRQSAECIRTAGHDGGYILSSACSVAPEAPPENIMEMHRACVENPTA